MSLLNDIVTKAITATQDVKGSVNTSAAVTYGLPLVKEDPEAVDQCIAEALSKRIKDAATRAKKIAEEAPDTQFDIFDLRPRHALDIEGRVLKSTREMTRLEFERIRQIRSEQVRNDFAYLARLDKAAAALAPIWDAHPRLTYGEAVDVYRQARGAA